MIALKTKDIRNNFKRVSDLINAGEKVLIARPHNENLVVMSEREYNELEKARRCVETERLAQTDQSLLVAEGRVVGKTIEELEEMDNKNN